MPDLIYKPCSPKSRPKLPQWSLKRKESDMPLATRRMARASVNGPAAGRNDCHHGCDSCRPRIIDD